MTFVLGLVLMLGILVFIHELGHFLVAKACGVRVLVFSIGFGPRLFGVKRGDTDYRISLLPLGGYVRMYGDNFAEEVPDDQKQYAFLEKPYLQKSAIAIAGPLANFLLPLVVLFFFAWGSETVLLPHVGATVPGEAAEAAGVKPGDIITSVDGAAVGSYRELREYLVARPDTQVTLGIKRGEEVLSLPMRPRGVVVFDPTDPGRVEGRIGIMPYTLGPLVDVVKDSPAAAAGLQAHDRITAINGAAVASMSDVNIALDAAPPGGAWDITASRVVEGEEKTLSFTVEAGPTDLIVAPDVKSYAVMHRELNETQTLALAKGKEALASAVAVLKRRRGIGQVEGRVGHVTEATSAAKIGLALGDRLLWLNGHPVTYGGEEEARLYEDAEGIHMAGYLSGNKVTLALFRLAPRPEWGMESLLMFGARTETALEGGVRAERDVGVVDAIKRSAESTWMLLDLTVRGIKMLVTGGVSLKSLGGPITIARVAQSAIEQGLARFVEALCFISVNLGLVNLLPIPVLDGGHLTIFTLEAIRRKKIKVKSKEWAYKVGLAMLGLVMVAAFYNDVMREIL